jgi:glycosyltransferase involved in cell wall biosynthesis
VNLVLDNSVFSIQRVGGVSTYWYQLFERLRQSDLRLTVLNSNPASDNLLEKDIEYEGLHCVDESRIPMRWLRYLPLRCKLPPKALFHSGYLRVSTQHDVANIVTLHDFAHERKLATRFPRSLINTKQKAFSVSRADGIICISESTRQDLLEFFPHTDPAKIRVIYHGICPEYRPQVVRAQLPFDLPPNFVLYVGARSSYKNFAIAVDTVRLLGAPYSLVAVGGGPWAPSEMTVLKNKLSDRYRVLPAVDVQHMNALYNQSVCLLYPSSYEGFGLPPGEAMKAGCPVVAVRRSSIPEVAGEAGLLVDEISAASFASEIRRLEGKDFRQCVVDAGLRRAALFTWDKCAAETLQFYRDCWDAKFSS